MSKVLVLSILLFVLYALLYRDREPFDHSAGPDHPARAIEPAWTRRMRRTLLPAEPEADDRDAFSTFLPHDQTHNYLLPQVTYVANSKADRLNALRRDLHATGQIDNSREHNLRYVHDHLLEPEVEFEVGKPTGQLKVRTPAYTPDWARFEGQNATLHILNYERYEDSDRADPDGITPFDATEAMQAAL